MFPIHNVPQLRADVLGQTKLTQVEKVVVAPGLGVVSVPPCFVYVQKCHMVTRVVKELCVGLAGWLLFFLVSWQVKWFIDLTL